MIMKHLYILLYAVIFLIACNGVDKPENTKMDCQTINGIVQLLADDGPKIIVVGESHGMQEPPAFVEALMCHSLSRGLFTALAIEVSDDEGRYKTYLESSGAAPDMAALFDDWMWKGQFTDGRSSEAMLRLIDQARLYQQAGRDLKVITFKADDLNIEDYLDRSAYTQAYENKMAENIIQGSMGRGKTIALVGNLHARRARRDRGSRIYDYMATHMPPPQTMTFSIVHRGGTSWNCRGPKPKDCGEHKIGSYVEAESLLGKTDEFRMIYNANETAITPFIGRAYNTKWYDGVIYIGAATASPPANLEGRIPYVEDDK